MSRARRWWVEIPWRRRNGQPEQKAVLVFDAATGKQVANAVAVSVTAARGEIVFQPTSGAGKYYVYYLPTSQPGTGYFPQAAYARPQNTADKAWRARVGLTEEDLKKGDWRKLPRAQLAAFETVDEYDKFTAMERSASPEEVAQLLAANPQANYLVFPEDREHPIRMRDYLPRRWIVAGPGDVLEGKACRGEFYTFQIGMFAARQRIGGLTITIEDLRPKLSAARSIPASAIRCFNQGGIDSSGRALQKTIAVESGKIGALWFGVQVPVDAKPGWYDGAIRVAPQGEPGTRVALRLEIDNAVLADAGDSQPWRHSRLRWLDSTIGADHRPVAPFTPLALEGTTIRCLGRDVQLEATGLPGCIRSFFAPEVTRLVAKGRPLLTGPMRFVAELPEAVDQHPLPSPAAESAPGLAQRRTRRLLGSRRAGPPRRAEGYERLADCRARPAASFQLRALGHTAQAPGHRRALGVAILPRLSLARSGRPGRSERRQHPSRQRHQV